MNMKTTFAAAVAPFFLLLTPVLPAQEHMERIALSPRTATAMLPSDAAAFWGRVENMAVNRAPMESNVNTLTATTAQSATATPAVNDVPGVVEVVGPLDDDGYVRARFISRTFAPGHMVCVGWKYTPSLGIGAITSTPLCIGGYTYPFEVSYEIFKGYLPIGWSGNYRYDAYVTVNGGAPVQVTGFANLNPPRIRAHPK